MEVRSTLGQVGRQYVSLQQEKDGGAVTSDTNENRVHLATQCPGKHNGGIGRGGTSLGR
jgi:hypothetical protein